MIRITAITHNNERMTDVPISDLKNKEWNWYWIDFNHPTEAEIEELSKTLHFHPLAIEDCIHVLQRPKLDFYESNTFFVSHSLHPETLEKEEINIFHGEGYIVTFHLLESSEVNDVWNRLLVTDMVEKWDPSLVLYHIIDKLVDNYFPIVYQLEDTLKEIEDNSNEKSMEELLDELFDTRHNLLTLRHTVTPMRDLVYRIINSHRLDLLQHRIEYFHDIHDHLLRLTEKIDASRELTADIRDSYLSLNSHQTNKVMRILTVITTIFMPLTFIAGIYGMNFAHMPELTYKYGYFVIQGMMIVIGIGMFLWFKQKGWFR
ncbi:magnesium/cobalt transporter CorA [Bacillus sp. REN16]|uniref:magnesium/cobalt transporter CorA n=1 Tax=Bacillus sp. REN16 TaxID=2887296 RepID=UPI001E4B48A0|nr:magnesium/cobalt transporter CorA [Bacillus sp. REN16]MCC3357233.1 magnesium/cobalt transporter CorA [Bacillus sp. REN16]